MNMISMSSFESKRIFDDFIITWRQGGRIKIENLKEKKISFVDYSLKALKKILESCENSKIEKNGAILYFTRAAYELLSSEYIEFIWDENDAYIVPRKGPGKKAWRLATSEGRQNYDISMRDTTCKLQKNARYELQDDGQLVFFEFITPENINTNYSDRPIVNVYSTKRK